MCIRDRAKLDRDLEGGMAVSIGRLRPDTQYDYKFVCLSHKDVYKRQVYSDAAFMIFSGVFSVLAYTKGRVKNKWMQVCTVINGIYAVGAVAIIGMSIVTRL